MKINLVLIFIISTLAHSTPFSDASQLARQGHKELKSYSQAREHLFFELHNQSDENGNYVTDVYCQKRFELTEGELPDHTYINTEHTWPQSRFLPGTSKKVQKEINTRLLYCQFCPLICSGKSSTRYKHEQCRN